MLLLSSAFFELESIITSLIIGVFTSLFAIGLVHRHREVWRDLKATLIDPNSEEYKFHLWQMRRRVFTSSSISLMGFTFIGYYFADEKYFKAVLLLLILILLVVILIGALSDIFMIQNYFRKKSKKISLDRRAEVKRMIDEKKRLAKEKSEQAESAKEDGEELTESDENREPEDPEKSD